MIGALTLLLVFQLTGEVLVRALELPVPGPVVGMALLLLALVIRGGPGEPLRTTSNGLLQHLSLLFVPAGTGVMLHFHRLADEWLPLVVALAFSTILAIAVAAVLLNAMTRRKREETEQ